MGVRGETEIRQGRPREHVAEAVRSGGHEMVVLGAPAPDHHGRIALAGTVRDLLHELRGIPVLIVRSPLALAEHHRVAAMRRAASLM
jgi:hypothetical protein